MLACRSTGCHPGIAIRPIGIAKQIAAGPGRCKKIIDGYVHRFDSSMFPSRLQILEPLLLERDQCLVVGLWLDHFHADLDSLVLHLADVLVPVAFVESLCGSLVSQRGPDGGGPSKCRRV